MTRARGSAVTLKGLIVCVGYMTVLDIQGSKKKRVARKKWYVRYRRAVRRREERVGQIRRMVGGGGVPTAFEDGEVYDLGEAECPKCGYPVIGYFQNGRLVKTDKCSNCGE